VKALVAEHLVVRYGEVEAVRGASFSVGRGEVFGLLGPNGAGKTSVLRVLTTLIRPHGGRAWVLGHEVGDEPAAVRRLIGYVPQALSADGSLTGRENAMLFARLHNLPRADRRARVDEALDEMGLGPAGGRLARTYSGGMIRGLEIACGLLHRPPMLLLDEPTVGLDPQVRQELWALIDQLRSEGVSILMSTHYIEEAERLADEVAIMSAGRIAARGRPAQLVAEHVGREAIEVYGPSAELREAEQRAAAAGFSTRRAGPALAILGTDRSDNGALPRGYPRAANLEDAFVLLTGAEVE
jgi:lipooligosaccharide transport system ATP-binding protein